MRAGRAGPDTPGPVEGTGTKRASGATEAAVPGAGPGLPAIGIEAEFEMFVDDVRVRPEDVFDDPLSFLDAPAMHRVGSSYQVETGGAVYFDTGVVEVATPLIEIEAGCAARAGRCLWETVLLMRRGLDRWEARTGRRVRLAGFSTHYNVSFESPGPGPIGEDRSDGTLAHLLAYVLPAPVMLLAANRRSTGVGVRPRGDRIEVTVDFTPSPALLIATATVVTAVVRAARRWTSYELDDLRREAIPVFDGLRPVPHTSRKGWLARSECFPRDPFACDVDVDLWRTTDGRELTLREMAWLTAWSFWPAIVRVSDPMTLQLVRRVLRGETPSLLDLPDRPDAYEDVGRLCTWNDLFPTSLVGRSRYERVVTRAISGRRIRLDGDWYVPVGMRGWSHVVFRPERGGRSRTEPLDALVRRLDAWEE